MLWKGASSSGKYSSMEVSYSVLCCRGTHSFDASRFLLTVAKHHSVQSITDEDRFKFSFRALTRIIKRVMLLGRCWPFCTTACCLLQRASVSSQVVTFCLAYLERRWSNKQTTTNFFALGRFLENLFSLLAS